MVLLLLLLLLLLSSFWTAGKERTAIGPWDGRFGSNTGLPHDIPEARERTG
jgi:hypothetical protein